MTEPIIISARSAATIRNMLDTIEAGQKAKTHLPTYINAVGEQLDVPDGWRFNVQTMAFVPPQEQQLPADTGSEEIAV